MLIYAPNTFTPDGDSFNQTWKVVASGIDLTVFDLFIYDRWGEKIWESHDLDDSWSGVYQGQNVPEGTYTWTLRVKDVVNDSKYYYNGHINLLR
jgi:gliding motility-associated-like protein